MREVVAAAGIAGLEPLAAGSICVDGEPIGHVPPERRPFGLMFQDHALFPHRTVGQNVQVGLRMDGVDPAARASRSVNSLSWLGLLASNDGRYHPSG